MDDVSTRPVDPEVEELLTALAAEPRPHELDGLAEPLAAYRAAFATPQLATATPRRAAVLTGLISARAAAAAGGIALGLAATAMAVAVSLPATDGDRAPVPPAGTTAPDSTKGEGVGPDAKGPAAHGLCTAWANHQRNGDDAPMDAPPMRNLAEAAGGAGKIAAYCATVPHPGRGHGPDKPGKGAGEDKATPGQGQRKDKPNKGADDDAPSATEKPAPTSSPSSSPAPSPTPLSPSPTSSVIP